MTTSNALKEVFATGRSLIEEWLDVAEQIAALREAATAKGLDWSQVKALLKAQIQDERAGETKRVRRIIEKAEFASSYADMLGLGNLNEKNFSAQPAEPSAPHPETVDGGQPIPSVPADDQSVNAGAKSEAVSPAVAGQDTHDHGHGTPFASNSNYDDLEIPGFLDRRKQAGGTAA